MAKHALLILLVFLIACSVVGTSHRVFLKGLSAKREMVENGEGGVLISSSIPKPENNNANLPVYMTLYGDDHPCFNKDCKADSCQYLVPKVPDCVCTSKIPTGIIDPRITKKRHFCMIWGGELKGDEIILSSDETNDKNVISEDNEAVTIHHFDDAPEDPADDDFMETDGNESTDSNQSAELSSNSAISESNIIDEDSADNSDVLLTENENIIGDYDSSSGSESTDSNPVNNNLTLREMEA